MKDEFSILHPDTTVVVQVKTQRTAVAVDEDEDGEGEEGAEGAEAAVAEGEASQE